MKSIGDLIRHYKYEVTNMDEQEWNTHATMALEDLVDICQNLQDNDIDQRTTAVILAVHAFFEDQLDRLSKRNSLHGESSFDQTINSLLNKYVAEDLTVADAGIGGADTTEYNSSDTYAPGDARKPHVLGTTLTRDLSSKKAKKKAKR